MCAKTRRRKKADTCKLKRQAEKLGAKKMKKRKKADTGKAETKRQAGGKKRKSQKKKSSLPATGAEQFSSVRQHLLKSLVIVV